MNHDMRMRRRAVYTGLRPYLPPEQLPHILDHWERHYSDAPRFKLQRFVADICQQTGVTERRADILLSLVQAMNMSAESLLREPDMDPRPVATEQADPDDLRAFSLFFDALLEGLDSNTAQQLRLDLMASLRQGDIPVRALDQLQDWLLKEHELQVGGLSRPLLRALVNRGWSLITAYLGPVPADRLLHQASRQVSEAGPAMEKALANFL